MKKYLIFNMAALALVFCLGACDDGVEKATGITLDKESVSIIIGNKDKINVAYEGSLDVREIKWTSKDENIATVTQYGVIYAVEEGSTEIEATWNGTTKTIPITVTDPVVLPPRKASWLFDDADLLKAAVGNPLQYGRGGSGFDFKAECPTTDISGFSAVAGPSSENGAIRINKGYYLQATNNLTPNGGGTKVNEYTMMWDIKLAAEFYKKWITLLQTEPANTNDGDIFINGGVGVGTTGRHGDVSPDEWHHIIASVKVGEGGFVSYYSDGVLLGTWAASGEHGTIDISRFALGNNFLLFGDEDGDDNTVDAAEIAIWDSALDANQVKKFERLLGKGVRP
ncbi:hypothetical protein AGMMS49965_18580 [Bacteroidia bacterium]|nr:hypothetical protein AGMMS49965_18580 [Bacteroidia bacterium]